VVVLQLRQAQILSVAVVAVLLSLPGYEAAEAFSKARAIFL
jgi:hypothetical protein